MKIKITKSEEKECDENYIKNMILEIQNELKNYFEEKDIEIKIFFSKEKYKMEIKERHIKPSEISSYILYEKKINLFAPEILKTIYRDSLNEKLKNL